MFLQKPRPPHDRIKGGALALIQSVSVMEFPRTVNAEPHQKVMIAQKLTPPIVKQDAIGLKGVVHFFSVGALFLHFHHFTKKIDP
jgi:hypothetical protein